MWKVKNTSQPIGYRAARMTRSTGVNRLDERIILIEIRKTGLRYQIIQIVENHIALYPDFSKKEKKRTQSYFLREKSVQTIS